MNIDQFMAGIRATESGSTAGNYTRRNSKSGAYGAYQFLERFWSDFLRYAKSAGYTPKSTSWPPNKEAQDTVFRGMVEYYSDKYGGNLDLVAVAWHCGHTCADAAVKVYGTGATPTQINKAVADAKGGVHKNEIAYIRNVYTNQGLSFNPDVSGGGSVGGSTGGTTMPTLRNGSTGEDVRALQQGLVAAGHNIQVDGVFGPATEAAVSSYQKANSLTVDGIAGPQTLGSMGLSESGGSSGQGSGLNLSGAPELWWDTTAKQWLVVYSVPGVKRADGTFTEDLYLSWTAETTNDLTAIVGEDVNPVAARSLSRVELTNLGVVNFGGVDELQTAEFIEGDPFTSWVEDMATFAITQPWLLEEDWQRLTIMAMLEREDGQLSDAEIETTDWWRTHSETERTWIKLVNGDPTTAADWLQNSRVATFQKLKDAGIDNITPKIANYMADQVTTGAWTIDQLTTQIKALSDPYAGLEIDQGLLLEMATAQFTPDSTRVQEDDVRSLLQRWLGPVYGAWTGDQISEKAGDLRNNPDAESEFVEMLKDQRVAMFPGVKDRESSYRDIAQPWKTFGTEAWGQEMDETDPLFVSMVNNNDAALNGELLSREGLKRNIGKVVNDTQTAMTDAWGGVVYS